jgi:hypothetical protein
MAKVESLVYSFVSKKHTEELRGVLGTETLRDSVKRIFSLQEGGKHEIMADFYCSICDFAHKHAYSNEQLSLLVGLMGLSLREALQQRMPREGCAKFFSVNLAKHSMHRPPFSIEVFSPVQEQEVLEFFRDSLFRHFGLYEVLFTPHSNITITTAKRFPNDLPHSLSLAEGSLVDPASVPLLAVYTAVPRDATPQTEQETADQQLVVEEEDQDEMTVLLNAEVAKIKLELEQRMKAQEEEMLRPFKGRKK